MARRMRTVAVGLAAILSLAAGAAEARVRVSVADFEVVGGESAALGLQLQDGFVQGLVRSGVQVLDTVDTTKRLEGHPELQRCDSSTCLKAIGQLLDVRYVVRVRTEVAGNSYKTAARVFSTEGAAPASLPIATKSKTCDVCTVVEARDSMVRLADMLRPQLEEQAPAVPVAPLVPPPKPPGITLPIVAAMVGAVSVAVGFAVIGSNGSCTGTNCSENRTRSAVGGALVGAGAVVAVMGTYVTIVRARGGEPVTGVAMTVPF
jgi:hypothetical protein